MRLGIQVGFSVVVLPAVGVTGGISSDAFDFSHDKVSCTVLLSTVDALWGPVGYELNTEILNKITNELY